MSITAFSGGKVTSSNLKYKLGKRKKSVIEKVSFGTYGVE